MMAEKILRIFAGLLVGVWVARYLGPEQFGVFSYVLAFTAIFGGIAKLGLDGILIRELVNQPELRDTWLGTAFWLKVAGAFLVMAIMALVMPFTSNDASTNLYIFIIAAGLVFQGFEVVEFYFQSQVLGKLISICKVFQLTLSSLIKVYLVLTEADLLWFVVVAASDVLGLALSYFVAFRLKTDTGFFRNFDWNIAKALLKDSWPLILSSLVVMIYMRIDQIMVKEMLGAHEVGIYSAAVRLSEAVYFVPVMISASLFPAILNAKAQSKALYEKRLSRLYFFLIWLAILFGVTFSVLGGQLVEFLYGPDYKEASQVLEIHIWACIFVFAGAASGKWYLSENLQKYRFINQLLGAVMNIILNYYLIESYGLLGAALSTIISYAFAAYLFDLFWVETRPNFYRLNKSIFGGALVEKND
ncbi:O-unit flippase [Marinobacter persicus]|nr:O-unit flippase [Marinobacter persicus]